MHSLISRLFVLMIVLLIMGLIVVLIIYIDRRCVFCSSLAWGLWASGFITWLAMNQPTEIGYLRSGSMYQFYKTLQ